jgi:hypothetical protein
MYITHPEKMILIWRFSRLAICSATPRNNHGHGLIGSNYPGKLTPGYHISNGLPPMDFTDQNHPNWDLELPASSMPAERNSEAKSTTAAMKERRFKLGR